MYLFRPIIMVLNFRNRAGRGIPFLSSAKRTTDTTESAIRVLHRGWIKNNSSGSAIKPSMKKNLTRSDMLFDGILCKIPLLSLVICLLAHVDFFSNYP
jgi:hypothetical protein